MSTKMHLSHVLKASSDFLVNIYRMSKNDKRDLRRTTHPGTAFLVHSRVSEVRCDAVLQEDQLAVLGQRIDLHIVPVAPEILENYTAGQNMEHKPALCEYRRME